MSLLWLLPLGLAALLALAIPLLIHLARREQQQPTMFAALRWLRERPRPRKRIRFDEWPLLLLRLLLLALLALWLARPVLTGAPDATPWTVVAPGVEDAEIARLRETSEGEIRWLARGFPPLSTPMPDAPQPLASLLRQLDADVPAAATITVLVPAQVAGLDAAPIRLSRTVAWRVLPGASPVAPPRAPDTADWVVRHDDSQAEALRIVRAAVRALRAEDDARAPDVAPIDAPIPRDAGRLAWLATGPVPDAVLAWIRGGGDALLTHESALDLDDAAWHAAWRDAAGLPLAQAAALGEGRVVRFSRPLRPADLPQVLDADFPRRLQALFAPDVAPTRAFADSVAPATGARTWPQAPRELQPWLALLIALLVLIERWWATSARRERRT